MHICSSQVRMQLQGEAKSGGTKAFSNTSQCLWKIGSNEGIVGLQVMSVSRGYTAHRDFHTCHSAIDQYFFPWFRCHPMIRKLFGTLFLCFMCSDPASLGRKVSQHQSLGKDPKISSA